MLPLSTRIARGLYADGIWTDTGFMPYEQIGGISWRDGEPPVRWSSSRAMKMLARRLRGARPVPGGSAAPAARQDRSHAIEMDSGPGLHLGDRTPGQCLTEFGDLEIWN